LNRFSLLSRLLTPNSLLNQEKRILAAQIGQLALPSLTPRQYRYVIPKLKKPVLSLRTRLRGLDPLPNQPSQPIRSSRLLGQLLHRGARIEFPLPLSQDRIRQLTGSLTRTL